METKKSFSDRLVEKLPLLVVLFCCVQPILDVLGYWQDALKIPNVLTLLLRMLLLAATVLTGYCLSDRKRYYWAAVGVLGVLALGHIFACVQAGYKSPIEDMMNQIRIYFLPMMTLCFITFLRRNEKVLGAIKLGFALTMGIFLGIMLLSRLTGTDPYTYPTKKIGVLGWFLWTNPQSAILSMLMPLTVAWALGRWKTKVLPVLAVTAIAEFALYILAPRLAYASLVAIGVGLCICMLLAEGKKRLRQAVAIFLCTAVFAALYPVSPTHRNQVLIYEVAEGKQQQIDAILEETEATKPTEPGETTGTEPTEPRLPTKEEVRSEAYRDKLYRIYWAYVHGLIEQFGFDRTVQAYDYSIDTEQLANDRMKKLTFCKLLLEDSPASSKWFGLDVTRTIVPDIVLRDGEWVDGFAVYDVENDFHGIYYLCGIVGLVLMIAFLLWFALRVLVGMCRNFRAVFTIDLAAFCAAYCTAMLHCYFTASILRRNNSSVYLAMVLAGMWYLTRREIYAGAPKGEEGVREIAD